MTDYNDGNWHGWNGGECPVHPESIGDVTYADGERRPRGAFGDACWDDDLLFRVTMPYVEPKKPREWWIVKCNGTAWDTKVDALRSVNRMSWNDVERNVIHVREVLE